MAEAFRTQGEIDAVFRGAVTGTFLGLGALFAGACLLLTPNSPSAAVWVALPVLSVWTAAFWPWALRLRHRVTALERISNSQPMEFCTVSSSSLLNCVRSSGPIARSLPVSVGDLCLELGRHQILRDAVDHPFACRFQGAVGSR